MDNTGDAGGAQDNLHVEVQTVCQQLLTLATCGTVAVCRERLAILKNLQKHWSLDNKHVTFMCCPDDDVSDNSDDDGRQKFVCNQSTGLVTGSNNEQPATGTALAHCSTTSVTETVGLHFKPSVTRVQQKNFICSVCGCVLKLRSQLSRHECSEHAACQNPPALSCKDSSEDVAHHGAPTEAHSTTTVKGAGRKPKRHCSSQQTSNLCDLCNFHCSTVSALLLHKRLDHGLSIPKPQADCSKLIAFQPMTAENINLESAVTPPTASSATTVPRFMCSVCGRCFRLRQLLATHALTHTGERPFACRFTGCMKRFGQTATRNYHERTHSDARPYVCAQCGLGYKQPSYLKIHIATVHDADGMRPHRCTLCPKTFKAPRALVLHMRNAHSDERTQACDQCPKRFKTRQQLQRHQRALHLSERPWRCTMCERAFAQPGNLQVHMRTHTGERPFSCTMCGMNFAHAGTLKGHMAMHRRNVVNVFPVSMTHSKS